MGERVLKEWLVTDLRGAFAMGTEAGVRERKYHGFFSGIAGRSETVHLADLEIRLNGQSLWPHLYGGQNGEMPVLHPDVIPRFRRTPSGPLWQWEIAEKGILQFAVRAAVPGGIELYWEWLGREHPNATLSIRPFFSERPLHALGGQKWSIQWDHEDKHRGWVRAEGEGAPIPFLLRDGSNVRWIEDPRWYYRFAYPEEARRGYESSEDLFSAGEFELRFHKSGKFALLLAENPADLGVGYPDFQPRIAVGRPPAADFVLTRPAGIVAGFPWFGEWGRDTFISLPGIEEAWLSSEGANADSMVYDWSGEILERWAEWIHRAGMLPNLLEKEESHQWESADATLWWCHALAALWVFRLARGDEEAARSLEERFGRALELAVLSIRERRHLFLSENASSGLLEVTEPHVTWMDARLDGAAVTPRLGALPEINALWFQARCLQALWTNFSDVELSELIQLGESALRLSLREEQRPNTVFLHSVPLAPSFVLPVWLDETARAETIRDSRRSEVRRLREEFWTPVGLRTLRRESPDYRPRCWGDQRERDQAYHQGPVWGWLGGHYEMARDRVFKSNEEDEELIRTGARPPDLDMPVPGHIAEIFDAEEPQDAAGAPAQAWSLACHLEAEGRRKLGSDARLTEVLARRWIERRQRPVRKKKGGAA